MQNVGTWNSDLALIFFGMLMLPILMYFCAGVFFKCKTVYITEPPEIIYKDRPAKTIYKQSPPKIVYRDRPKKKKKKKKKNPVAPKVVDPIEQDGIDHNQYLRADSRRSRRTISINFEYRFGEFEKKKYRREDQGTYDRGDGDGGMDQGF